MDKPRLQISVAALLAVVACLALNFWLFRLGVLWGILGLNVTKHVGIAFLCHGLGVDRAAGGPDSSAPAASGPADPRPNIATPALRRPEASGTRVDLPDTFD
jgi:hypothetical protein